MRKTRKRKFLVISAGGSQSGLQCLYFIASNDAWEIIAHSFIPYPQKVIHLFEQIAVDPSPALAIDELAWLDYRLSILFSECAKATLTQLPTTLRSPHCVVLNRPSLWKGPTNDRQQLLNWNLPLGDAQHLASTLSVPVITDLMRHQCIAGGAGLLPVDYGNRCIAARCDGDVIILINLGLVARMTIVDRVKDTILIDSDTGPGTCSINAYIQQHGGNDQHEGFDRDGSLASQGAVDGECLRTLSEDPWFLEPAPKQATPQQFNVLLQTPQLTALHECDRLSTITALTARTIYDFYRREFKQTASEQRIFISGGGSYNQTLLQYIRTFFDTIPVESIEDLGIPADMRIPLALGLTINAYTGGLIVPWESGNNPKVRPLGKWVVP